MSDTALIVSAIPPVPVDNGKRLVLHGLLTYFVERLGAENVHYALVAPAGIERPEFPGVAHRLDRPSSKRQLTTLASRLPMNRSYTVQEAMLGAECLRKQVLDLALWLRPTIEVYDTLRMGQHAPEQPRPRRRILYLDDLFSVRYERMLEVDAADGIDVDPLGEFAENVPAPLRALVRRPAVYRSVLRMERERIRKRETQIVGLFDASLLINEREVQILRERSDSADVHPIKGLIPDPVPTVRRVADPPELVFVGRLNVPHNDDAICSFVRSAMPRLRASTPDVTLRIIGKGASSTLLGLAAQFPDNVRVEGFVADLEPVFARATVALAPMRFGSGVKIKMLEALARGVPVLATTVSVDGIPVEPAAADGCIVDDDLAGWPDHIVALTDPTRNEEHSRAARAFFARTYGRRRVMADYDAIFGLGSARLIAKPA